MLNSTKTTHRVVNSSSSHWYLNISLQFETSPRPVHLLSFHPAVLVNSNVGENVDFCETRTQSLFRTHFH